MHNTCGVDPGLEGAYAILANNGKIVTAGRLATIPHGKNQLIDPTHFYATLRQHDAVHTVIENVSTRPKQGIASNGNFMRAVGTIYGVARINGSVSWVTPVQWKRFHGLLKLDKEASRRKAIELWPESTHLFTPKRTVLTKKGAQDVAEAALIGLWYVQTSGQTVRRLLGSSEKKLGLIDN